MRRRWWGCSGIGRGARVREACLFWVTHGCSGMPHNRVMWANCSGMTRLRVLPISRITDILLSVYKKHLDQDAACAFGYVRQQVTCCPQGSDSEPRLTVISVSPFRRAIGIARYVIARNKEYR